MSVPEHKRIHLVVVSVSQLITIVLGTYILPRDPHKEVLTNKVILTPTHIAIWVHSAVL